MLHTPTIPTTHVRFPLPPLLTLSNPPTPCTPPLHCKKKKKKHQSEHRRLRVLVLNSSQHTPLSLCQHLHHRAYVSIWILEGMQPSPLMPSSVRSAASVFAHRLSEIPKFRRARHCDRCLPVLSCLPHWLRRRITGGINLIELCILGES